MIDEGRFGGVHNVRGYLEAGSEGQLHATDEKSYQGEGAGSAEIPALPRRDFFSVNEFSTFRK